MPDDVPPDGPTDRPAWERSAERSEHGLPGGELFAEAGRLGHVDLGAQLDGLLERGRTGEVDPEDVQRGLASLVLTLVEVLRELMERQAVRRMESGTLTDDETEQLGRTFLALRDRMDELKETFGLSDEDLNLDLGPLGRLR